MAERERPVVVSTRVTPRDRALIGALAEAEGATICVVLYRLIMPALRARLAELARETPGA